MRLRFGDFVHVNTNVHHQQCHHTRQKAQPQQQAAAGGRWRKVVGGIRGSAAAAAAVGLWQPAAMRRHLKHLRLKNCNIVFATCQVAL